VPTFNFSVCDKVIEYVAFLRFRSRFMSLPSFDENRIAKLYRKFAKEDRELTEEGTTDYASGLIKEDRE